MFKLTLKILLELSGVAVMEGYIKVSISGPFGRGPGRPGGGGGYDKYYPSKMRPHGNSRQEVAAAYVHTRRALTIPAHGLHARF